MQHTALNKRNIRSIVRTGRIVPAGWDDLDAVAEVMLQWSPDSEEDPGELLLHPADNGQTLLLFVGREVTVTGRLGVTDDGEPVLRVRRFRVHRSRLQGAGPPLREEARLR